MFTLVCGVEHNGDIKDMENGIKFQEARSTCIAVKYAYVLA